jgi:hypothetical protein
MPTRHHHLLLVDSPCEREGSLDPVVHALYCWLAARLLQDRHPGLQLLHSALERLHDAVRVNSSIRRGCCVAVV